MYLNIFLVVLILLGIVLMTKKIKNYTVVYLLLIILIFLSVKKLCQDQKEYFENLEDIQRQLQESVAQEASENAMRGRINDLETTKLDSITFNTKNEEFWKFSLIALFLYVLSFVLKISYFKKIS